MASRKSLFLLLAIVALLLTGCRATRNLGMDSQLRKMQNEQIQKLIRQPKELDYLTAKTTIAIDYEEQTFNVKGRLRMHRNEVVQLSITALGVVEVAFIEFTPEAAYLLDRVSKRYAKIDYSSGILSTIGLNFETVQALFWNRIFMPGKEESKVNPDNFVVTLAGSQLKIEPTRQFVLKSQFLTDTECTQLQQTQLAIEDYSVTWRYDIFKPVDTLVFPTMFDISVSADEGAVGTHVALSSLSTTDKDWSVGTNLSRYTKVELKDFLSILKLLK